MTNLDAENYLFAHYIYEDESLVLAAKIRSGGILGSYWYNFMIMNRSNGPIKLNYLIDVTSMILEGKKYQLHKLTRITAYPSVLNPDSFFSFGLSIEKRFNNRINDIEELKFQFNQMEYTLSKNESVTWE